jgi:hypothetical protein
MRGNTAGLVLSDVEKRQGCHGVVGGEVGLGKNPPRHGPQQQTPVSKGRLFRVLEGAP